MAPRTPTNVQSYTVLPLTIPPTSSFPSKTTHYIYARPHEPKLPTPTISRELFLVNIPIDSTTTHIRSLFADQLGGARVEDVAFDASNPSTAAPAAPATKSKKRKRGAEQSSTEAASALPATTERALHHSGASAVVRFVDNAAAELAMREVKKAAKSGRDVVWGKSARRGGAEDPLPPLGAARYARLHALRYPPAALLSASVDAFMAGFAEREADKVRELAKRRQMPDEDGFVTVVRGGRAGPARMEVASEKLERQREKQKGKEDFYRFQTREKNKERARGLVRGFEEDRRTVENMKSKRGKFRPQ